jgi:hypothetical protein
VVSRRAGLLHWASAAGLLALLVMGPLASSARVADQLVLDGGDAAAWDALDRQVRADQAQGVQDVTVPRLAATSMVHNLDFVGPDREDWFNVCVARYYGVRSIAATEE